MKVDLRIPKNLLTRTRADLQRPHAFAAERVGFFTCRPAIVSGTHLLLIAASYEPLADDDYIRDLSVGAMMGARGIRQALQTALNNNASMFHVHMHEHLGKPGYSRVDIEESKKFVPDFFNVAPAVPHGTVVLSLNSATGLCWLGKSRQPIRITTISSVGTPTELYRG